MFTIATNELIAIVIFIFLVVIITAIVIALFGHFSGKPGISNMPKARRMFREEQRERDELHQPNDT